MPDDTPTAVPRTDPPAPDPPRIAATATRELGEGDEAALHELARMAFGRRDPFDPLRPRPARDRHRCVYEGGRLVASAATRQFAQAFGGRLVPCGGLADVMIATDRRGRGLGRRVVHDSLVAMRSRGEVISALYPSTASLYRSLGYEIAGSWSRTAVALSDLPPGPTALDWEPARPDDRDVAAIVETMARRHDGWLGRADDLWRARAHRSDDAVDDDCFVGRRDARAVAAVWITYREASDAEFGLDAGLLAGTDHRALTDALAFVGAHGTTAREVTTTLPSHLLDRLIEHPQRLVVRRRWPWMLRLVDVDGALRARGWNPAVTATVTIGVTDDPVFADQVGPRRLVFGGGSVEIGPGEAPAVSAPVTVWAAWYAGASLAAAVARGAAVAHDPGAVAVLDAVTATGTGPATCPVFF